MSQADDLLAQLNPRQREAACHGRGPLLIIAGAGTGKTTTLAHRVAHLIGTGTDPRRMMLLTFTRRAAAELLRRVDALLRELDTGSPRGGRPAPLPSRQVWGGTFHAVATRLLRQHGRLIGLNPEFTILDRSDSEDLLNVVRGELELTKPGQRFPLKGTCLAIYSRCVNARQRVETVLQESFPWCLEWAEELTRLFETFVDRKEQQRLLDYDDLLLFWQGLVAEPAGAKAVRAKFD